MPNSCSLIDCNCVSSQELKIDNNGRLVCMKQVLHCAAENERAAKKRRASTDWFRQVSASIFVKRVACGTPEFQSAEQLLKNSFRVTKRDLEELYDKHEMCALWYKNRLTSTALISVHPTLKMVNVVYFATLGYLSSLHFGTVLDCYLKCYAAQRGCTLLIVTSLGMSLPFWKKLGYEEWTMPDDFAAAYAEVGAVRLRDTSTLRCTVDPVTAEATLLQAGKDADLMLSERAERSARSTIALRVLVRHEVKAPLSSTASDLERSTTSSELSDSTPLGDLQAAHSREQRAQNRALNRENRFRQRLQALHKGALV
eukprot:NODE_2939_length_1084_cov_50.191304_g2695_i0.p1 GENE.NODE_2939_length_1084_cov_50.191304_g2695_i0~~NODE_2939_length_1084_cov_50.191304_g2695_i0.p1  ORF type:complete len:313 (+),score=44.91 NODE_2939_length_1084_cov_50.191304_g2695_i0:79-1017(+)